MTKKYGEVRVRMEEAECQEAVEIFDRFDRKIIFFRHFPLLYHDLPSANRYGGTD